MAADAKQNKNMVCIALGTEIIILDSFKPEVWGAGQEKLF